jgi:hypothetical protein
VQHQPSSTKALLQRRSERGFLILEARQVLNENPRTKKTFVFLHSQHRLTPRLSVKRIRRKALLKDFSNPSTHQTLRCRRLATKTKEPTWTDHSSERQFRSTVEKIWQIQDKQGQILAFAFRKRAYKYSKVSSLRSEADRTERDRSSERRIT